MTTLRADSVTVRFGGLTAINDASIEVPDGGFVGLIGPNGAGKTTLFNVISGFLEPTRGRVLLDDRDLTGVPASARAKLGIGRTFQKLELFGRMTVFENLMVAAEAGESHLGLIADLLSLPKRRREERRCAAIATEMLTMLDLGWAAERRASDVPLGTARILELGRALSARPRVLLLDEPSSGLDAEETAAFGRTLKRINEELGIGILIVEHDMDLVMEVCKRITVLDFGVPIAEGTPSEIVANPNVRAAYLGEEDDDEAVATSP